MRLDAAEEQSHADAPPKVEANGRAVVDNSLFVLQRMLRRAAHCCDGAIGAAAIAAAAQLLTRPLLAQLTRGLEQTISTKLRLG